MPPTAPGLPVPPEPGPRFAAVAPATCSRPAASIAPPSGPNLEEMRRDSVQLYAYLLQTCAHIRPLDAHLADRLCEAGSDLAMRVARAAGQVRGGTTVTVAHVAELGGLVAEIQTGIDLAALTGLAGKAILDPVSEVLDRIVGRLDEMLRPWDAVHPPARRDTWARPLGAAPAPAHGA